MDALIEKEIGVLLQAQHLTLAVAESCTGGLVGHRITNVPGSSAYYLGSVTAYAYEAKVRLLGVSWDTLNAFGAVSRETVAAMAQGIRKTLNADLGAAVSGIAGPGGGTEEKPVGTTWVGLSDGRQTWTRVFCWDGDRLENKAHSAQAVLEMLLAYLQGGRNLDGDFR